MTTLVSPPAKPSVPSPSEVSTGGTVLLQQVPWEVYLSLRDQEANNHIRMTYDGGRLELMAPARRHERVYKLLGQMVQVWTDVLNIPRSTGGQTTLRRQDLSRGVEPDESFHIQHEAVVRALDDLKLPDDPPPDLVIESDVTHSSVPRLPIFAAMGVPEVWRWKDGQIHVYHLESGEYVERSESRVLPGFPFHEARRLIGVRNELGETEAIRSFREWVTKSCKKPRTDAE